MKRNRQQQLNALSSRYQKVIFVPDAIAIIFVRETATAAAIRHGIIINK